MGYIPNPIDLTSIELGKTIEHDVEKIARNIHETWAMQRVKKGWGYGESYDDIAKKHPCMIEYEKLPEVEREMDRATVVQTIKMLLWLGYTIEKKES